MKSALPLTSLVLAKVSFSFFFIVIIVHTLLRLLRYRIFFDMDQFWPISLVNPKLPVSADWLTLLALVLFWLLLLRTWTQSASPSRLLPLSAVLILLTNLLQGIPEGFITPIAGDGSHDHQYWQDAVKITSVPSFLHFYTTLQPTLNMHSRVHPPGPTLFVYLLQHTLNQPLTINLFIFGLSFTGVVLFYHLSRCYFSQNTALLLSLLYASLPATHIYYLATIDALITTLFLLTFYFLHAKSRGNLIATALSLWLASFFTFAAGLLAPLILYFHSQKGQFSIAVFTLILFITPFLFLFFATGFNYWENFLVARTFESSSGFYLFDLPLSYFFTRLENVLEILVFFTPSLTYLLYLSLKSFLPRRPPGFALFLLLPFSLLLFFLTGAYFTGETARAANYVYPFLLLLIGSYVDKSPPPKNEQINLLSAVLLQSVIMQLFGNFNW